MSRPQKALLMKEAKEHRVDGFADFLHGKWGKKVALSCDYISYFLSVTLCHSMLPCHCS